MQMARAVSLMGVRSERAATTRGSGDLSNALWGEFHGLTALEGGDLDNEGSPQTGLASRALLELVDARQIAELVIGPQRARSTSIGSSKTAAKHRPEPSSTISEQAAEGLARRYRRPIRIGGFYKALKELRQVEAEAQIRIEPTPDLPIPDLPDSRMGSFCEATPPSDRERALAFLDAPMAENPTVRGSDGKPLSITRPLPPPV